MHTSNEPIRTMQVSLLTLIARSVVVTAKLALAKLINPSLTDEAGVYFVRYRGRDGAVVRHKVLPVKAVRASSVDMPVFVSSNGDIQASSPALIKGSPEALMTLKHVIVVPTAAIQHDDGGPFVYVVFGGKAMLRRIRRGPERDNHSVIFNVMLDEDRRALRVGDAVIVESGGVVSGGASVRASVMPATFRSIAAY